MSVRERFERLEERERKLLGILGLVVGLGLVLLAPLGVTAALHTQRTENESLREAIQQVESARSLVDAARQQQRAVEARYANAAPALAGYLAKLAAEVEVEIPESQDRQPVLHAKRYEERSTKIVVRKVGMWKLANFMQKIAQSGHPIAITQLSIRKRSVEQDSYDADMIVSAFDRKAEKAPAKSGADGKPAGSAKAAGEESP